jgi:hypothetical protein
VNSEVKAIDLKIKPGLENESRTEQTKPDPEAERTDLLKNKTPVISRSFNHQSKRTVNQTVVTY